MLSPPSRFSTHELTNNMQDTKLATFHSGPVRFGEEIKYTIVREYDTVHSFYAHVRIGALPPGAEWKPNLFARIIRSAKLIGADPTQYICIVKAEDLMIKLHTGLLKHPNGLNDQDNLTANSPWSSEQEFCIPLFLKDEIGISPNLINLAFHELRLHLEIAPLSELLMPGAIIPACEPSLTVALRGTGILYPPEQRPILCNKDHIQHLMEIRSDTVLHDTTNSSTVNLIVKSRGYYTTGILHITDEDGLEIPKECVDTITLNWWNNTMELSAYEAKRCVHPTIYWNVKDVPASENIYYLSRWFDRKLVNTDKSYHYSPKRDPYSRIRDDELVDEGTLSFTIKLHQQAVPKKIRMTLAHGMKNYFIMKRGMGGMYYPNTYSIYDSGAAAEC